MNKKILTILLLLTILCHFVSCANASLPEKIFDSEFKNSFSEKYKLVDTNLKYLSASEFDIKVNNHPTSRGTLHLSKIDDTDINTFVAVSDIDFVVMPGGGYRSNIYVYQSESAPSPMTDWTIQSVVLLNGILYGAETDFWDDPFRAETEDISVVLEKLAENYMNYYIENSQTLKEYSSSENESFVSGLKLSYQNGSEDNTKSLKAPYKLLSDGLYDYSLLVRFEENSNIVWHTYLYQLNGKLYMECCPYGEEKYYVQLSDEINNELIPLIEADSKQDIPDSTTAEGTEETTEDPYQPTTEDPDGSIAWPYDD